MGWPINQPVGIYGEIIAFLFPSPPSKTGWRAGGKKAASHMEGSYLDWALADFSGYIAADELYDGPFCVLFVVETALSNDSSTKFSITIRGIRTSRRSCVGSKRPCDSAG
jgi:hypothetical protein